MEGVTFQFGNEYIIVNVNGNDLKFANTMFGALGASIEGLKLSKQGTLKEFPDLKDREDWRQEAIKRFKEKIANIEEEPKKVDYIIGDLRKYGYKPLFRQKNGFRRVAIK